MRFEDAKPVLHATYRRLDEADSTTPDAVCAALGKPPSDEQTLRAITALYEERYIDGLTIDQAPYPIQIHATLRGRE